MKLNTLSAIALLMASTTALADTMTLKIPLKVVLMRDEAKSVRVNCAVTARPYSSGASAANAALQGNLPTTLRVKSDAYPLDPFGNLDRLATITFDLDQIQNLDKHFLQSNPVYSCSPEFLDAGGQIVLDVYEPTNETGRAQLYDQEASTFHVSANNFVPDSPSRMESLLGGRSADNNLKLKAPAQGLKLQR